MGTTWDNHGYISLHHSTTWHPELCDLVLKMSVTAESESNTLDMLCTCQPDWNYGTCVWPYKIWKVQSLRFNLKVRHDLTCLTALAKTCSEKPLVTMICRWNIAAVLNQSEVEQLQRAKLVTLVEGSVLTLWIQSLCGCLTIYDT